MFDEDPSSSSSSAAAPPARPPCPFFTKLGACRFGSGCARDHVRPASARTLILSQVLPASSGDAESMSGNGGPIDDSAQVQAFCTTLLDRVRGCGTVQQLIVLCNQTAHLRGTMYLQFASAAEATAAIATLKDESSGPAIRAEPCDIDFRDARCTAFDNQECNRGAFCNFLHVRALPEAIQQRLAPTQQPLSRGPSADGAEAAESRSPFASLADVEIRLVMHNLGMTDRLQLARCSQRTLHAANNSHAWKHLDWRVHSDRLAFSLDRPVALSRLLRHCRMSLFLAEPDGLDYPPELLNSLADHQLFSLDLSDCARLPRGELMDILETPAVQNVQQLSLHDVQSSGFFGVFLTNANVIKAVLKLQKLQSLSAVLALSWVPREADLWKGLAAMPALTSLTVMPDPRSESSMDSLKFVAACPHLRQLHLCGPRLFGDRFLAFFGGSPALRTLESLTLDFTAQSQYRSYHNPATAEKNEPVSSADLIKAFNCLPLLHTVKLVGVPAAFGFLAALMHIPAVTRVVVLARWSAYGLARDGTLQLPSPAEVSLILSERPSLRLSLLLWNERPSDVLDPQRALEFAARTKLRDQCAEQFLQMQLVPAVRARLTVRCADHGPSRASLVPFPED